MSLRLDKATIAKIEADRIYDLILPETEGKETVTVPLSYLENVQTTGQKLQSLAPAYISRALEKLGDGKVHRFRRKAVIPKESLASSLRPPSERRRRRRRGVHRERDAGAIIAGSLNGPIQRRVTRRELEGRPDTDRDGRDRRWSRTTPS